MRNYWEDPRAWSGAARILIQGNARNSAETPTQLHPLTVFALDPWDPPFPRSSVSRRQAVILKLDRAAGWDSESPCEGSTECRAAEAGLQLVLPGL